MQLITNPVPIHLMNGSPSTQATTGTMLCLAKKPVGPNVVAQPSIPVMNGQSVNISILLSNGKKSGSEPARGLKMRGVKPFMLQPPSWSFPQRVFRRPKSVEEFVCTLSVFVCFHPRTGTDWVAVAEDVVHAADVRPEFVFVQIFRRKRRLFATVRPVPVVAGNLGRRVWWAPMSVPRGRPL